MKTYQRHNCTRRHRTYAKFAQCAFRQPEYMISGEGEYASVAWCAKDEPEAYRRCISVHLFTDLDEALAAKKLIDDTACGGRCKKQHEVIRLQLVR